MYDGYSAHYVFGGTGVGMPNWVEELFDLTLNSRAVLKDDFAFHHGSIGQGGSLQIETFTGLIKEPDNTEVLPAFKSCVLTADKVEIVNPFVLAVWSTSKKNCIKLNKYFKKKKKGEYHGCLIGGRAGYQIHRYFNQKLLMLSPAVCLSKGKVTGLPP